MPMRWMRSVGMIYFFSSMGLMGFNPRSTTSLSLDSTLIVKSIEARKSSVVVLVRRKTAACLFPDSRNSKISRRIASDGIGFAISPTSFFKKEKRSSVSQSILGK